MPHQRLIDLFLFAMKRLEVKMNSSILLLTFLLPSCALAKEILIIQKNKSFQLESSGSPIVNLEVNLGDVIRFRNNDEITHNVYSISSGNEFEIKVQRPGETGVVAIDPKKHKKGKMEVECAIHPQMKLLVNIKK